MYKGRPISKKAERFQESVIRDMTRRCGEVGGINLSQGFPGFDAAPELIEAAIDALRSGHNQYSNTWGAPAFLEAIAEKLSRMNGIEVDPYECVTVTCGATEAMMATMLALIDPGDEVIIIEPFYENYGPDTILSGATPRFVRLEGPNLELTREGLEKAFNDKTRAIIINTPHNPSGRVFTREELGIVAELCEKFDAIAITDEIYESVTYDGAEHISIATLPGMSERTVTICGLSKTYSVSGWRLAYAAAAPAITLGIRKVHDFLTVGAPHPLQIAGVRALAQPESFYEGIRAHYVARRDILLDALERGGYRLFRPEGSYFVLCEIPQEWKQDDFAFARHLLDTRGVAGVPGSSFYHDSDDGRTKIRFHFAADEETLRQAAERLAQGC